MRPCGVHTTVLKGVELVGVMAKPLSVIYQSNKDAGEVPANWKTDGVITVHKRSMREDPGKVTIDFLF